MLLRTCNTSFGWQATVPHEILRSVEGVTGEVRAELQMPAFDALADRFEDITYGGDAADSDDTDGARREWPHVVTSARRS